MHFGGGLILISEVKWVFQQFELLEPQVTRYKWPQVKLCDKSLVTTLPYPSLRVRLRVLTAGWSDQNHWNTSVKIRFSQIWAPQATSYEIQVTTSQTMLQVTSNNPPLPLPEDPAPGASRRLEQPESLKTHNENKVFRFSGLRSQGCGLKFLTSGLWPQISGLASAGSAKR